MAEADATAPAPLILVADDDPMTCLLAEESLREAGFRSYGVQTCQALRESIVQLQPDGILVNPELPDGDALATIRAAAAVPPALVVLTERQVTAAQLEAFFRLGMADFIVKPVAWEWLGVCWRQALRRQRLEREHARLIAEQGCLHELVRLLDDPAPLPRTGRIVLKRLLTLPWPTLYGGGIFAIAEETAALRSLARIDLEWEDGRPSGLDLRQLAERRILHPVCPDPGGTGVSRLPHDLCAVALEKRGVLYGALVLACVPRCRWDALQLAFLRAVAALLAELLARHGFSGVRI